jgi:hypothetical protein
MLERDDCLPLGSRLDWKFWYVSEREEYPEVVSGAHWLCADAGQHWDEPQ